MPVTPRRSQEQPGLWSDAVPSQEQLFDIPADQDPPGPPPADRPIAHLPATGDETPRELPRDSYTGEPLPAVLPPGIPPVKSAEQIGFGDPLAERSADVIVDRTIRLLQFLVALENRRREPVRDYTKHEWSLALSQVPQHPLTKCGITKHVANEGIILEVTRPQNNPRPEIRAEFLLPWLKTTLDDPHRPPEKYERLPGVDRQRFDDDHQRVLAWEAYLDEWRAWAEKEGSDAPVRGIYDQLAKLHDLLAGNTERYQLLLAEGLLTWDSPAGRIHHPIVGRRVEVAFDMANQKISLTDTGEATAPLFSCLRGAGIPGEKLAAAQVEVRENAPHPLRREVVATLIAIRNRWFSAGAIAGTPVISIYPLVLLVPATEKATTFLESVISDIAQQSRQGIEVARASLPSSLRAVVGDSTVDDRPEPGGGVTGVNPEDPSQRIFFTKESNEEQARVVAHLRRHPRVVVLGPPGTGKTHTIANLIGHFLAEGKTVLVTSQTAKALGEVRSKVVPNLRDLCIALLATDIEGRAGLKGCVNGIKRRLQESTKAEEANKAKKLLSEIDAIGAELLHLRARLRDARLSEITPIVISGESIDPISAAEWVAANATGNDWIPVGVSPGVSCPLSAGEVSELYLSNAILNPEDELELSGRLPLMEEFPASVELANMLREDGDLEKMAAMDLDGWPRNAENDDRDTLAELACDLERTFGVLREDGWEKCVLSAGIPENPSRGEWEHLLEMYDQLCAAHEAYFRTAASYRLRSDGADVPHDPETAEEIRMHIDAGGNLGFLAQIGKPRWKHFLSRWQVDGASPKIPAHMQAIEAYIRQRLARRRFETAWQRTVQAAQGPPASSLGSSPVAAAANVIDQVKGRLAWHEREWMPLLGRFREVGIGWEELVARQPARMGQAAAFDALLSTVEEGILPQLRRWLAALDLRSERQRRAECGALLSAFVAAHSRSTILTELLKAWGAGDATAYHDSLERMRRLDSLRETYLRRKTLTERLAEVAPGWADAVARRNAPHDKTIPPGDPVKAWRWRQLTDELDRRASEDLTEIGTQIERKSLHFREVVSAFIQARAWQEQYDRAQGPRQNALDSWLATLVKYGAGHRQDGASLLAEASKLLKRARPAVPVWIMPLDRVYQTIEASSPRFDVLIVDEASQLGPEGIGLLYLADQVVVVGDDEQVTPSAVGITSAVTAELRRQFLFDVPNSHLYDGTYSMYGIGENSFNNTISLQEHFRCVPDIIRFSNQLCYIPINRRILPLREESSGRVFPALVPHRVMGHRKGSSKINEIEARRVAALFGAMLAHPAYQSLTFGIISMLGQEQSLLIDTIIRQRLMLADAQIEALKGGGGMTRRLCGAPPDFQGDERDVVLVSLVDSPDEHGAGPLRQLPMNIFKSRYNVAASRAKDQLWVVYSLDENNDLQSTDLRRRLIEHARKPRAILDTTIEVQARAESPFERAVAEILIAEGYRVVPQYPAGAYRIDLVVEGAHQKLAVECDGKLGHSSPADLTQDIRRQEILERRGWQFVRIRGSAFYRNRRAAMQPVFERLQKLNIQPGGAAPELVLATQRGEDLVAHIVARAEALEREWEHVDQLAAADREQRKETARTSGV